MGDREASALLKHEDVISEGLEGDSGECRQQVPGRFGSWVFSERSKDATPGSMHKGTSMLRREPVEEAHRKGRKRLPARMIVVVVSSVHSLICQGPVGAARTAQAVLRRNCKHASQNLLTGTILGPSRLHAVPRRPRYVSRPS